MKKIALTCGDPAGVGPEIISRWLAENPEECVAIGTGDSFNLQGYLRDCISEANNRLHG